MHINIPQPQEQHVYHHYDNDGPRVTMKAEKNSKSINYEVAVSGAKTPEEARDLLRTSLTYIREELEKHANGVATE